MWSLSFLPTQSILWFFSFISSQAVWETSMSLNLIVYITPVSFVKREEVYSLIFKMFLASLYQATLPTVILNIISPNRKWACKNNSCTQVFFFDRGLVFPVVFIYFHAVLYFSTPMLSSFLYVVQSYGIVKFVFFFSLFPV